MVPADDENKDTPEVDNTASTKECKGSRLTPMPKCLMHWWIPFVLAAILFLGSMFITSIWGSATFDEIMHAIQDCPKRWPFHMRTPSREEIEVCLTITAAGFAFSAWQQRSHDNAVKEKQEQATIERDDYWKRREHIFQLLGSKNPGLRLGAVALLAELADKAAQSEQLNKTEQQQLQRHIIDTLCLQLRHEGIAHNDEGSTSEHAQIQEAILETILTRIEIPGDESPYADWSRESINITSCVVHTPVYITNLTTYATIDLSQSRFLDKFELNNANIPKLIWERAYFMNELVTRNNSTIGIKSLPQFAPISRYLDTTFIHNSGTFSITLESYANLPAEPTISLSRCKFTAEAGKTKTCTPLQIYTSYNESTEEKAFGQNLYISDCELADITVDATYIHSHISIVKNSITGRVQINLAEQSNKDGILERTPHASDRIQLRHNVIHPGDDEMPIAITNYTDTNITNLIRFYNNHISRENTPEELHTLEHAILMDNPKPFLFFERTSAGNVAHRWKTGGGREDLDLFSDSIFNAPPKV